MISSDACQALPVLFPTSAASKKKTFLDRRPPQARSQALRFAPDAILPHAHRKVKLQIRVLCTRAGLLHPADTVMDLNIGAALWLSARARGRVRLVTGGQGCLNTRPYEGSGQGCLNPKPYGASTSSSVSNAASLGLRGGEADSKDSSGALESNLSSRSSEPGTKTGKGNGLGSGTGAGGEADSKDRSSAFETHLSSNTSEPGTKTGEGNSPESSTGGGGDLCSGGRWSAESGYWQGGREYTSAARVVLVGHGADEQCAGYGRHRTKFRHNVRRSLLLAVCKHNPNQLKRGTVFP